MVLNDQSRPKLDDKEEAALFFGNEVKSSPEQACLTTTFNNYQIVVINTPHPESEILVNNSQILLLNLKILSVIQSWIIG